jgi:hypothetical protein
VGLEPPVNSPQTLRSALQPVRISSCSQHGTSARQLLRIVLRS